MKPAPGSPAPPCPVGVPMLKNRLGSYHTRVRGSTSRIALVTLRVNSVSGPESNEQAVARHPVHDGPGQGSFMRS